MPPFTGDTKPLQAIAMYGWDTVASEWVKIIWSGGALAVNIDQWGGVALTGRDITTDIAAILDVLNSIGDAGVAPTNVTGETVLKKLDRAAESLDTVGAVAGVLRTLGDAGAGAVDVAGDTMLSLLSQILTAIGAGGGTEFVHHGNRGNGAAPFNVDVDVGQYGGSLHVTVWAENTTNDATITIQGSYDGITYRDLFDFSLAAGGETRCTTFQNAYRYLRGAVSAMSGGTTYLEVAASR